MAYNLSNPTLGSVLPCIVILQWIALESTSLIKFRNFSLGLSDLINQCYVGLEI